MRVAADSPSDILSDVNTLPERSRVNNQGRNRRETRRRSDYCACTPRLWNPNETKATVEATCGTHQTLRIMRF